jgi:hypothetical protein
MSKAITNLTHMPSNLKLKFLAQFVETTLTKSFKGKTNAFLFFQQILCQGTIHKVYDVLIEESKTLNDPTLGTDLYYKHANEIEAALRIDIFNAGSKFDELMAANFGERRNATFDNMAYASVYARLDRENPQFGGVPDVQFLAEGKTVRSIIKVLGPPDEYVLENDRFYSNNPALVLLDYLTDSISGKSIKLDRIDLKSFYDAAQICDTTVQTNVRVAGNIWRPVDKSRTVYNRNLPLYEANLIIDTKKTIRENVEVILSTMGDARLVWSQGKYKLSLQYPATNDDIIVATTITDDDLVLDQDFEINFPTASQRLNHCTVKFHNEAENFKEDTASWPPKLGPNREIQTYLIGIGASNYGLGTAASGWDIDKPTGSILNDYSVWDGNAPTTTLVYLFKIAKELVAPPASDQFTIEYAGDDRMNFTLKNYLDNTIVTSGSTNKWNELGVQNNISLGDSSADRVYKLEISAQDTSTEQPLDKGSRTKSRGVAVKIIRGGNEIIWSTREPTYDDFIERTVSNHLYRDFLDEDNGKELEEEIFVEGITDYYHALAKAEEIVRTSRGSFGIKFKYFIRDRFLEPGDYIKFESQTFGLGNVSPLYIRVNEVALSDDFTCVVEGNRFEYSFLAWNVKDDEYIVPPPIYDDRIPTPLYLQYIPPSEPPYISSGRLEWEAVSYSDLKEYVLYMHIEEYGAYPTGYPIFKEIGRTNNLFFILPKIDAPFAIFGITVLSKSNKESQMTFANMDFVSGVYRVMSLPINRPWLDSTGQYIFNPDGSIEPGAYVIINGEIVYLSNLFSAVTYNMGTWTYFPTQADLGDGWKQNATVIVNGVLYILTDLGNGLEWVLYNPDGLVYFLVIESSNGDVFHVGEAESTVLSPRLFKNGAEVTDQLIPEWVRWRRTSRIHRPFPDDDITWNDIHITGFLTLTIDIDDIESQATFFCDIIPISPFNAFWNVPEITANGQSSTVIHVGGAPPVNVEIAWVGDHTGLSYIRTGNTVTVYEGDITPVGGDTYIENLGIIDEFNAILITGNSTGYLDTTTITDIFSVTLVPNVDAFPVNITPISWISNPPNNSGPVNQQFTANASGGSGTYSYSWSTTGMGFWVNSGHGTDTVQIYCENDVSTLKVGTVYCIISDGISEVAVEAPLEVTYGSAPIE